MDEIFNVGLGVYTRGTRHAEKTGKSMGKIPLGDAKLSDVFPKKKLNIRPILIDHLARARALKIKHGEL